MIEYPIIRDGETIRLTEDEALDVYCHIRDEFDKEYILDYCKVTAISLTEEELDWVLEKFVEEDACRNEADDCMLQNIINNVLKEERR